MKRLVTATLALALLSGGAFAQATSTQPSTSGMSSSQQMVISQSDLPKVRQFIQSKQSSTTASTSMPSLNFLHGQQLPQSVQLHRFDSGTCTNCGNYQWAATQDKAAIVDQNRNIVQIIDLK